MLISFLCVAGLAQGMAGGLVWEKSTIEAAAKPADKTVTVDFLFRNASDHPVEVRKIRTSCGCTVAESSQKTYAPGEKGTVKVVFTIGGRKGIQEKTVLVETSEKGSADVLTLRVNLPDSVKINKEMLVWEVGDPLEPQSFEVTVTEPGTSKVKAVRTLGTAFEAVLKEIEVGKKYLITVVPAATDRPAQGTVRLEVADPGTRAIYLRVRVEG